jgi:YggT family protein
VRTTASVLDTVLAIYIYVLLAAAILSWLIGFKAVTTKNRTVARIDLFLSRATDPVRRPLRWLLPNLGGVDVSPILLIALIVFLRYLIEIYLVPVTP